MQNLSTANLCEWPTPETFLKLLQSLHVLALCQDDVESFLLRREDSISGFLGEMANGQGDTCRLIFSNGGMVLLGFAHEAATSSRSNGGPWPGTFKNFPKEFAKVREHFLDDEDVSFCAWYVNASTGWQKGSVQLPEEHDADGSEYILSHFPLSAEAYVETACEYYGRTIDLVAVKEIYAHTPLTLALVAKINDECSFSEADFSRRTGYPIASGG